LFLSFVTKKNIYLKKEIIGIDLLRLDRRPMLIGIDIFSLISSIPIVNTSYDDLKFDHNINKSGQRLFQLC